MRARYTTLLYIAFLCVVVNLYIAPDGAPAQERLQLVPTDGTRQPIHLGPAAAAILDTLLIAEFTFDDGVGGPDPQGWTTVDYTATTDTFFHVDDFAVLGGGSYGLLTPLEGAQSLWCGARPGAPGLCQYATLPGYGNHWNQTFASVPFATSGDVTLDPVSDSIHV
jgi:hypothetical protein